MKTRLKSENHKMIEEDIFLHQLENAVLVGLG